MTHNAFRRSGLRGHGVRPVYRGSEGLERGPHPRPQLLVALGDQTTVLVVHPLQFGDVLFNPLQGEAHTTAKLPKLSRGLGAHGGSVAGGAGSDTCHDIFQLILPLLQRRALTCKLLHRPWPRCQSARGRGSGSCGTILRRAILEMLTQRCRTTQVIDRQWLAPSPKLDRKFASLDWAQNYIGNVVVFCSYLWCLMSRTVA